MDKFVKRTLTLVACILVTATIFASRVPARAETEDGPLVYWGAEIDGAMYGYANPPWDMRPVTLFESHVQKKMSVLHIGFAWFNSQSWPYNNYYPFIPDLLDAIRQRGMIPLVSWASWDGDLGASQTEQPRFSLASIIRGEHDAFISQWATGAKNWGHHFFLRFDWEMNGNWFPWSEQVNGNQPGEYVKAWQHVHDIFTTVGATNVTWVWCPNTVYKNSAALSGLYPGDRYVDWTCVDAYNNGTNPLRPSAWLDFRHLFEPTYDQLLVLAPTKPMMIGEIATTEVGGNKAAWITDLLNVQLLQHFPRVRAFTWFNWSLDGWDWQIESSAAAQNAFVHGIASNNYAANEYSDLSLSPIPAPYHSPPAPLLSSLIAK